MLGTRNHPPSGQVCPWDPPSVSYCGFKLSTDGYRVDDHLVKALHSFPVPTNGTDVRSFCGLVQQFQAFSPSMTPMLAPIRSLLSPKSAFVWEIPHQEAFQQVIRELTNPTILANYKPDSLCSWRPTQPNPRVLAWPSGSSSPPESGESSNINAALATSPQPNPDTQEQRWNCSRSCGRSTKPTCT